MNKHTLCIFVFSFIAMTALAEKPMRPECEQWLKSAQTVVNLDGAEPRLREGKSTDDLLQTVAAYPDEPSYTLDRTSKTSEESLKALQEMPGCKSFTYWNLKKWLFSDPSFSASVRKKSLQELIDRTLREEAGEPSTVALVLRTHLFNLALEKKILKVNDPAYFTFSHLAAEVDRFQTEVRSVQNPPLPEDCLDEKNRKSSRCTTEAFDLLFHRYQRDARLTSTYRKELARWVNRVRQ